MNDIQKITKQLLAAKNPESIFGPIGADNLDKKYRELVMLVHPDKPNGDTAAFQVLNDLRDFAEEKIKAGTYGDLTILRKPLIVRTAKSAYTLTRKLPGTEIANFYSGKNETNVGILFKVAKVPRDNELITNEVTNLKITRTDPLTKDNKNTLRMTPLVLNNFTNTSGKIDQGVVVFEEFPQNGFTIRELRTRYPNGVPLEHVIWIMNRMMGALENHHALGIAHGALIPENVIVYPDTHGVMLTNWDFSLKKGDILKGTMGGFLNEVYYPDEVFYKTGITLSLDIFMLAKLFIYLVGGNVNQNKFPDWIGLLGPLWDKDKTPVFKNLEGLIRACLLSYTNRTQSLITLYPEFRAIAKGIFGPPQWREMTVPAVS